MTRTSTTQLNTALAAVLAATLSVSAFHAVAQTPPVENVPEAAGPPVSSPTTTEPSMDDVSSQAEATATTTIVAPKDFMQQAFLANEFGIAAAQLAVQKADSAAVKAAAQGVLDNGLKVREGMVAAIQGSTSDMNFDQSWNDDYKQKLADLQALSGPDFDAKYLEIQGEVTNTSSELYASFAGTASDPSAKTFATQTLPMLTAESDALESVSMGGQ